MSRFHFLCCLALLVLASPSCLLAEESAPEGFKRIAMDVDGVRREALVHAPASAAKEAAPLVFIFHGHGGSMQQSARSISIHREWPDAICVYPQGLNTPGKLTDPEGKKPGWQHGAGAEGDRDLKFFDALLARLKKDFKVDEKRIYATGHSNGGGFTYLLWRQRPDVFAAFAPSGAAAVYAPELKPKPALHIAGDNDPLVKFAWQKMTMDAVRKVNGCDETGETWAKGCTSYPSKSGAPLVTFIQSGGHKFPAEAPALIVKFFKEHPAGSK